MNKFDIAIIGSGIAGSALGAILARHGQKVVTFEAKSHPRFAIGESMILETSETLRAMAELYDVPELAYFSSENYFAYAGTSHGIKRHFSYLYHSEDQAQDPRQALQAIIPKQPYGHELHLYRQDTDYFMMTTAVSYGATVLQNTPVQDVQIEAGGAGSGGVEIITAGGERYQANYVVDAGGFRSLLAQKYDLRDLNQRTHSRAIFTHMVGVPRYHDVGLSQKEYGLPFRVSEGTLHHLFPGGWLWVIPFDNHEKSTNPLCSVGLMLDPRVHPLPADLSPQEEFFSFIEQFPSLKAQFHGAHAVRAWTRTGRIQYSSKQIVGDRFCLLGHAAGFIDPLFSKGLYASLMSTSILADLLLDAHEDGDYSAARFQPLEQSTRAFIQAHDRLIASSYRSFDNYKLWVVVSVLWLAGAYTELVMLSSIRLQMATRKDYYAQARRLKLVGGGFDEFDSMAEQIFIILENVDIESEEAVDKAFADSKTIFEAMPWMPQAFIDLLYGKTYLPNNKLRISLFKKDEGFLGSGAYRQHFFGDHGMREVTRVFVRDKIAYSTLMLNWKRRTGFRKRAARS